MTETLTILSPVPEPGARTAERAPAGDLPDRVRVGTLANGKPNTPHLLDGIMEVLAGHPAVVPALGVRKETASEPAPPELIERLVVGADLVVGAIAD